MSDDTRTLPPPPAGFELDSQGEAPATLPEGFQGFDETPAAAPDIFDKVSEYPIPDAPGIRGRIVGYDHKDGLPIVLRDETPTPARHETSRPEPQRASAPAKAPEPQKLDVGALVQAYKSRHSW